MIKLFSVIGFGFKEFGVVAQIVCFKNDLLVGRDEVIIAKHGNVDDAAHAVRMVNNLTSVGLFGDGANQVLVVGIVVDGQYLHALAFQIVTAQ